MKPNLNRLIITRAPKDGFTEEEVKIIEALSKLSISNLYGMFPTARMKAIVALHFELGYDQHTIAEMFNVTQGRISQEINMIKKILAGRKYKAVGKPTSIDLADLMRLAMMLSQS